MVWINIKPKGLQDFLAEDYSLTEKITFEEFVRRNQEMSIIHKNDGVEEAYNTYLKVLKELESGWY